jgi:hypothetical protein
MKPMSPRTKRIRKRAQLLAKLPSRQQDHDVLVFPVAGVLKPWEYFRLPVNKEDPFAEVPSSEKVEEVADMPMGAASIGTGRDEHPDKPQAGSIPVSTAQPGEFTAPPEKWDPQDLGARKVLSVAYPGGLRESDRGPAFAILPVKPDPGSSSFPTCFVVNVNHLKTPNLWTAEEWNDGPSGPDFATPAHNDDFEVLLAAPRGKVFRLKITGLSDWEGVCQLPQGRGEIECVQLGNQAEIWAQLRNGCIAGRVAYHETIPDNGASRRILPLVNITALTPDPARNTVRTHGGAS